MKDDPSQVSQAVRKLRLALGESQQAFAYRMKAAVRTIARWETTRPPKGKVLNDLRILASDDHQWELAQMFSDALADELGSGHQDERAARGGGGMKNCEECKRLRAELLVRTSNYGFPERPERFRKSGARSAYDSGYEVGWRNQTFSDPYTRPDCMAAYYAGYRDGEAQSLAEIGRDGTVIFAGTDAEFKRESESPSASTVASLSSVIEMGGSHQKGTRRRTRTPEVE